MFRYGSRLLWRVRPTADTCRHCWLRRGLSTQREEQRPEEPCDKEEEVRRRILDAAMPFVAEHGWSRATLEAGAEEVGLSPAAHGLFSRGAVELVFHFVSESNEALRVSLEQEVASGEPADRKSTGRFIQDALQRRLEMIVPYQSNWHQAMALQAMPQNSVESWRHLLALVDDVWFYAGDRSTDMNWYTKRATAALVYKSTELCLLTDSSHDQHRTWSFLARRLEDVKATGSALRSIGVASSFMKNNAGGLLELARNMTGVNSRR